MPDIPNWCWHEYGNRVGFWRLLQVYDEFKIPGVMNINGTAVEAMPELIKACVERKWEFVGHGYTQRNMQKVDDERADVRKCIQVLEKATGQRPRGWLGPGLTETWETPDILAEEGYDYVADWVIDDQPVWLKTRGKPIVNIPYTQECNDVAMMLIQHHKANEFYERAMDQFEQIYKDSKDSARVMAISVHPYIMGAPHRAKYFRKIFQKIRKKPDVLFWTGAQIADWCRTVGPKAPFRTPFVPANAGTQGDKLRFTFLALDSRLRGNERRMCGDAECHSEKEECPCTPANDCPIPPLKPGRRCSFPTACGW
jgi:peptidoglycan/xylan/chitin deacetylase (PgdA/CDA1 family)